MVHSCAAAVARLHRYRMISLDEAVEVLTGRKQLFLAWIREAAKNSGRTNRIQKSIIFEIDFLKTPLLSWVPQTPTEEGNFDDFKTRSSTAAVMGRLSYCLMAGALFSGSCSLLAQNTAFGNHEGFPGASIHRQICSVTADCCANVDRTGEAGSALHISIGSFTLSPQNAPTLVMDDSGAGTGAGNPLDIYTSNSTGAQVMVREQYRRVAARFL